MLHRRFASIFAAAMVMAALAGCNMGSGQTPPPTQGQLPTPFPTGQLPILTPTAAAATSAPAGAPTAAPTKPQPTQPSGSTSSSGAPTRVTFAAGATYASVSGTLPAHGSVSYVVNIMAGQLLDVASTSATNPLIKITGADNSAPKNVLNTPNSFRGVVPTTQDYVITLSGSDQQIAYTLNITIPQRLTFDKDATQLNTGGAVAASDVHQYVINLGAGQLLDVEFQQGGDTIHTQIYGVDGNVLQSGMGGGAGFRGKVPASQDYIINVVSNGAAANYKMSVIVPQQVTFAAGATSATLSGTQGPTTTHQYAVDAAGGQTLDVVWTPDATVKLAIYGIDGAVLSSGNGQSTHFTGKLPTTQTYIISAQTGGSAVTFQLVITIK